MKIKLLVVTAAVIALSGTSYAEGEKAKAPKKEIAPEVLEKYDTDKDGKLSKEEMAVMKKDKAAEKKAKAPKAPKEPKAPKVPKEPKAPKVPKEPKAPKPEEPKPEGPETPAGGQL